jgi:molecular chaperone HscB
LSGVIARLAGIVVMDPFATLGIPRSYALDLSAVEKTHRELSRTLHPDKYVDAGASERRAALTKAVEVNEAWRVVRDPIRRADALLALAGVPVGEEAKSTASPEFLMEMLEQREALADAKSARDLAAVRRMGAEVEVRSAGAERELAEGFAKGQAPELKGKVDELRYYRRFLEEVSAIEDELAA